MNAKKTILFVYLSAYFFSVSAQSFNSDYQVIPIHKKVSEISYESPCESPLANYLERIHLWVDGKYDTIYSGMIDAIVKLSTIKPASPEYAERLLNSTIEEVIIYKDSVGFITRKVSNLPGFPIGCSQLEDGKWKGTGEDYCPDENLTDVHQYIEGKATSGLLRLRRYDRQTIVSTDTLAFVDYLQQHRSNPKDYLLDKLANHPLVIYGEIHRRKISWDFLKKVINDPEFVKVCGTVFVELPFYTAPLFDKFLHLDTLNSKIILDILGSEQIYGWQDKGEYEFIEEIWKLNKQSNNKIKIVPVDFQIPWEEIRTKQDLENYERDKMMDRDSTMANLIEKTMKTKTDTRHCLFIVGMDHARKLSPAKPTKAGTLLAERFPKGAIFSIMPHTLIDNNQNFLGKVRYGLYDFVFEQAGNHPIAFDLSGSPFGQEPFDAIQSLRFDPNGGKYEDFYDGYIFLGPLKEEEYDYTLFELFTDDFVNELKRRAAVSDSPWGWYDIPAEELSKEKIIDTIKDKQKRSNNKRYSEEFWKK